MRIRDGDSSDPGWKKVGSGINIPDPQHWFYLGDVLLVKVVLSDGVEDPERVRRDLPVHVLAQHWAQPALQLAHIPPALPHFFLPLVRTKSGHIMASWTFATDTTWSSTKVLTKQCWGSVTFWWGSGSSDSYLWLMDPNPIPDATPFFSDFKDAKRIFHIF